MLDNDKERFRIYVRQEDIFLFENLLAENNLPFLHDYDYLTNTKSGRFYIRKIDLKKVDEIANNNKIYISDDYVSTEQISSITHNHYFFDKTPKAIRYLIYLITSLIVVYIIFQDYL